MELPTTVLVGESVMAEVPAGVTIWGLGEPQPDKTNERSDNHRNMLRVIAHPTTVHPHRGSAGVHTGWSWPRASIPRVSYVSPTFLTHENQALIRTLRDEFRWRYTHRTVWGDPVATSASGQIIAFGEFEVKLRSRELCRRGVRVRLADQSFEILTILLEHRGELVTRDEIRNRLWPGDTFVDFDHGLNNAVNRLREALGDSAERPLFIETLPRRGYRFIGSTNGDLSRASVEASEARLEAQPAVSAPGAVSATVPVFSPKQKHPLLIWSAIVIASVAVLVAFTLRKSPVAPSSRLFVLPPEGTRFNLIGDDGGSVTLSPDGKRLAFVAVDSKGTASIWVRSLGKLMPEAVDGTAGASFPFWSPDGRSIGFFSEGKLKRVPADGSTPPTTLCEAPFGRGGSWSSKGVIIFAPNSHSGIYQVAESGGDPAPITTVAASVHTSHRWPRFLPDGDHFIYLAVDHFSPADHNALYLTSLDGKQNKVVVATDADATFASGYLFFARKDVLMAQRFNPKSGELEGEPQATPEKVLYDPTIWKTVFDASETGVMAYQLGDTVRGNQLQWFNRKGASIGVLGEPAFNGEPRISHDGRELAVAISDGGYSKIWVYDLTRTSRMQITFGKYDNCFPIWPSHDEVLFAGKRQHYAIYAVDSHGMEPEHLLLDTGKDTWPLDVSRDGRFLIYGEGLAIGRAQSKIWVFPMTGRGRPFRLLEGDGVEGYAQFSPDGRWIAYNSNESGRDEVYIVPFDPSSRLGTQHGAAISPRWQISISGGHWPRWRRDGRELFYWGLDDNIMAVPVTTRASEINAGKPHPLFRANPGFYDSSYDVSLDGKKFMINTAPQEKAAPITVVENWPSDLRK